MYTTSTTVCQILHFREVLQCCKAEVGESGEPPAKQMDQNTPLSEKIPRRPEQTRSELPPRSSPTAPYSRAAPRSTVG